MSLRVGSLTFRFSRWSLLAQRCRFGPARGTGQRLSNRVSCRGEVHAERLRRSSLFPRPSLGHCLQGIAVANAAEIQRRARYAVESFCSVDEWETPDDYLAAVDESMRDLCRALGKEPPSMPEAWIRG